MQALTIFHKSKCGVVRCHTPVVPVTLDAETGHFGGAFFRIFGEGVYQRLNPGCSTFPVHHGVQPRVCCQSTVIPTAGPRTQPTCAESELLHVRPRPSLLPLCCAHSRRQGALRDGHPTLHGCSLTPHSLPPRLLCLHTRKHLALDFASGSLHLT